MYKKVIFVRIERPHIPLTGKCGSSDTSLDESPQGDDECIALGIFPDGG